MSSTCRPRARWATRSCATTTRRSATRARATCAAGRCSTTRSAPVPPARSTTARRGPAASIRHDGRWHLFYTGLSHADARQRIGVATSRDLLTWERDDLVLEADARWYDAEDWRDPLVAWDQERERFDMVVCAKHDGRGIAGYAHSPDLRAWTVAPPISEPTEHFHLEVPQLARLDGAWRLIFSDDRAGSGIHYLSAPERLGPYPAASRDLLPARGRATTTPAGCSRARCSRG